MAALPLIPSTVVGSHGKPGWWFTAVKAYETGAMGPSDLEETDEDDESEANSDDPAVSCCP